jgi:predicted enzyme related to lactoylglutathione lyase
LDESLKRSSGAMTLKCVKENEKALRFYKSMGWKILREETDAEGNYYVISSDNL